MRYLAFAFVVLSVMHPWPAPANEFQAELEALAKGRLAALAQAPEIIAALAEQNSRTSQLDATALADLDRRWTAETRSLDQPQVDALMSNPLSKFLELQQASSGGLFSALEVGDASGLCAGQSELATPCWHPPTGNLDQPHIGAIEQDAIARTTVTRIRLPVLDPRDGTPLGTLTVSVNIERL